jgi:hypothetical protein
MITKKHVTRLLLTGLCIVFAAMTVFAADPYVPIGEDDVSLESIKSFFDAAFMKADFDEDGDLKIEDGSFKTYVRVDEEKKLITFFAAWALRASVSELKKLQFVNTLNDDLIFVRFVMTRPTVLWCDYQFLYEGGITPYAIVNNYRLFALVTKGAVATKDPEDIIGSD